MSKPQSLRSWFLNRHAAVSPRLDLVRCSALPTADLGWFDVLRALFLPQRTAWTVLAAIWLTLAIVHFLPGPTRNLPTSTPPQPEAVASWLQQIKSHETFAQATRHP